MISQCSCVFMQHNYDQSDKHNNPLFVHAQLQNSVGKSLKHKKEHNSDIERDKLVEFQQIACWMSEKHY